MSCAYGRAFKGGVSVVAAMVLAFWGEACGPTGRAVGEPCWENGDCQSGICRNFVCQSVGATDVTDSGVDSAVPSDPGRDFSVQDLAVEDSAVIDTSSPDEDAVIPSETGESGCLNPDLGLVEDNGETDLTGQPDHGDGGPGDIVLDDGGLIPSDDGQVFDNTGDELELSDDGANDDSSVPDDGAEPDTGVDVHDAQTEQCPLDMVAINNSYCIDRYEASRSDATSTSAGTSASMATSRAGVMPWFPVTYEIAQAACVAVGKRTCRTAEIQGVCDGGIGRAYVYGNAYNPTTCNGIDTYCDCSSENCVELDECPYQGCYLWSPEGVYRQGCRGWFGAKPTGSFANCVDSHGVYDINGNVWELVDVGNGESWYKGGAYNCSDSRTLHRCDGMYQNISAKGFRCCRDIGR